MKTFGIQDYKNHVVGYVRRTNPMNEETDNTGQIVVYTGLYLWSDQTIRDTAEPVPVEPKKEE